MCLIALTIAAPVSAADSIWVEGEAPTTKSVNRHNWYDSVKEDALSGGDWLSHFNAKAEGAASYTFTVTTADTYTFWLRANPVKTKLSYRIDNGQWALIDMRGEVRGQQNIAKDNKPDLRFIAWIKVAKPKLAAGKHTLEFKFHSGPQNHGGIDAIVFVRVPWAPSGTQRPSAATAKAATPDTWFPFAADDDAFSPKSVTDCSNLIPAPAGQFGFLQRVGGDLKFTGAPAASKFWAVGSGPGMGGRSKTPKEMEQAAKWFRKHGINLVRQHTVVGAVGLLDAKGNFDATKLDTYDRWFATLKAHGIYTTWSVNYPHHGAILRKTDGYDATKFAELDATDKHRNGAAGQAITVNDFVNLDPELQAILWRYTDKLLNHVNPYTKLAYKNDPALAVLEVQNESNLFFHTLNDLRKAQQPTFARMMRRGFFEFLKKKYGSKEAVAKAWGQRKDRDDRWEQGEMGLMAPFHWGTDGPLYEFKGQHRRGGDRRVPGQNAARLLYASHQAVSHGRVQRRNGDDCLERCRLFESGQPVGR